MPPEGEFATANFIWEGQDVLLETDGEGSTQVTYTQTPEGRQVEKNCFGKIVF